MLMQLVFALYRSQAEHQEKARMGVFSKWCPLLGPQRGYQNMYGLVYSRRSYLELPRIYGRRPEKCA